MEDISWKQFVVILVLAVSLVFGGILYQETKVSLCYEKGYTGHKKSMGAIYCTKRIEGTDYIVSVEALSKEGYR